MTNWSRAAGLAFAVGCSLSPWGALPQGSQPRPERLTTDTPEYCLHLQERLRQVERDRGQKLPPEVTLLSDQGQLACDHGEVARGIHRLRRAMRMVLQPAER